MLVAATSAFEPTSGPVAVAEAPQPFLDAIRVRWRFGRLVAEYGTLYSTDVTAPLTRRMSALAGAEWVARFDGLRWRPHRGWMPGQDEEQRVRDLLAAALAGLPTVPDGFTGWFYPPPAPTM